MPPDSTDVQQVVEMDQDESDESTSESEEEDEGINSDWYSSEDWVPSREVYGIAYYDEPESEWRYWDPPVTER